MSGGCGVFFLLALPLAGTVDTRSASGWRSFMERGQLRRLRKSGSGEA